MAVYPTPKMSTPDPAMQPQIKTGGGLGTLYGGDSIGRMSGTPPFMRDPASLNAARLASIRAMRGGGIQQPAGLGRTPIQMNDSGSLPWESSGGMQNTVNGTAIAGKNPYGANGPAVMNNADTGAQFASNSQSGVGSANSGAGGGSGLPLGMGGPMSGGNLVAQKGGGEMDMMARIGPDGVMRDAMGRPIDQGGAFQASAGGFQAPAANPSPEGRMQLARLISGGRNF